MDWFWKHLASRSIKTLENKCMKKKCAICKAGYFEYGDIMTHTPPLQWAQVV